MSAITIDNDLVHYEVLGRGRPVILLHGWLSSWRYWIPSMQQLSMKYRTYALDLWGYGDSGKDPNRLTLDAHVELLGNFMDKLGIPKAAFVGHSLGAAVMIRYARENPARVARLMAISPPVFERKQVVVIPAATPGVIEPVDSVELDAAPTLEGLMAHPDVAAISTEAIKPTVAVENEPASSDPSSVETDSEPEEKAALESESTMDEEDYDEFFPQIELDELVALLTVDDEPFFPIGPEKTTDSTEVASPDEPTAEHEAVSDAALAVGEGDDAALEDAVDTAAIQLADEAELGAQREEAAAAPEPSAPSTKIVSILHERLMTASPQNLLARYVAKDVPEYDRLVSEIAKTAPTAFESSVKSFDGVDFAESIRQMSSPTLLVHGENDAFMPLPRPELIDAMDKDREGFRCVVWPEMNHFPMLEDPTSFHRLVMDFLEARDLNDLEFKERWVRKVR